MLQVVLVGHRAEKGLVWENFCRVFIVLCFLDAFVNI